MYQVEIKVGSSNMCYPSFHIFWSSSFFYACMVFFVQCSTSRAKEISVNGKAFHAFDNFINAYHRKEQTVTTNYFRICGQELIRALIKTCTPINGTYPCFQSSTNTRHADKTSNRSYRRGVATSCCDFGRCSQEYLTTFCCERLNVAR
ncbi:Uncharacterized protein ACO02O_03484 [Dirofilaria immitis]|nr:hypothetical protein [Dirofilaria immitis]